MINLFYFCIRWSFGITLWEIFTLGLHDPYPSIPNKEFIGHIQKIKNRKIEPPLPSYGSKRIHEIIKSCWEVDFKRRPTFKDLVPKFEELLSENQRIVKEFQTFVLIIILFIN